MSSHDTIGFDTHLSVPLWESEYPMCLLDL